MRLVILIGTMLVLAACTKQQGSGNENSEAFQDQAQNPVVDDDPLGETPATDDDAALEGYSPLIEEGVCSDLESCKAHDESMFGSPGILDQTWSYRFIAISESAFAADIGFISDSQHRVSKVTTYNDKAKNPVNITLSDAFNSVRFDSENRNGVATPTYLDYYFALDGPTGKYFKADTNGIKFRLLKKVPGPDPLLCASEIHTRTPDGYIELGDICQIE